MTSVFLWIKGENNIDIQEIPETIPETNSEKNTAIEVTILTIK